MEKIRFDINNFNVGKTVSDPTRIFEDDVFGMQTGQIVVDSLSIQIKFWKQVEQLHLISSSLANVICNLDKMINSRAIAPADQINFVEELLSQRQNRYKILLKDANELFIGLNSGIMVQMKDYLEQVSSHLTKNSNSI